MENMELTKSGKSKVERYNWKVKDEPGGLHMINKNKLAIHTEYQRNRNNDKILRMAAEWSWIACGAIVVGLRDGVFWVIDGQHRVSAALRRSDIIDLPCVVFLTETVHQDARGFLDANTNRKAIGSIDRYRALIAANDENALFVKSVLDSNGIVPSPHTESSGQIKAVGMLLRRCAEDRARFTRVFNLCLAVSKDDYIRERIFEGFWYIDQKMLQGITDPRFQKRAIEIGSIRLQGAANKAAAFYSSGGQAVWAAGIMEEINKGLRNKFELNGSSGK